MPFELPDLPYAYDALEPHIDAETMRIHHDLHHKAYVDNANAALAGTEWADRPVESLSLGVGRLVEIGRALMTGPKLVLLDEPSSGLDRHETEALTVKLRAVQKERGIAILLVEHDVDFVRSLVQRVFVLDFGTLIASGPTAEVFADDAVRRAYLGDLV